MFPQTRDTRKTTTPSKTVFAHVGRTQARWQTRQYVRKTVPLQPRNQCSMLHFEQNALKTTNPHRFSSASAVMAALKHAWKRASVTVRWVPQRKCNADVNVT